MNGGHIRSWIAAVCFGALAAPVQAEMIHPSDTDSRLYIGLCARTGFDGNCMDGKFTAKDEALFPSEPEGPTLPHPPLGGDDLLKPITEAPPFEPHPTSAVPTNRVPEPAAPVALAIAAVLLASRRRRAGDVRD